MNVAVFSYLNSARNSVAAKKEPGQIGNVLAEDGMWRDLLESSKDYITIFSIEAQGL